MAIYFGGSRSQSHPQVPAVVAAVVASGQVVHVGCQLGADAQVISVCPASSLVVFAVAPQQSAPLHVLACPRVVFSAGGSSAPIPARYLLRSIAAFQGCEAAVFFMPGPGSLAVAREFAKTRQPIFAFSEQAPAPIAGSRGKWCIAWFHGFQCWGWGYLPEPTEKQMSFI